MSKPIPDPRQEPLIAGDVVQLITAGGRSAHAATVSAVDGELIRVRGELGGLSEGLRLRLRHVVPEDARYTADVQVERAGSPLVVLRRLSEWRRVQQREYVRLRLTHPIQCDVEPLGSENKLPFKQAAAAQSGQVVDLSAGGLQLETDAPLPPSERLRLTFTLTDEHPTIVAEGVVVRQVQVRRGGHRAGIRFTAISRGAQSRIQGFINAEQAARRRTSLV